MSATHSPGPAPAPAGWYIDPAVGVQRYWNGQDWAPPAPTARPFEPARDEVTSPHDGRAPASWYPDPFGRYELRFWDGGQWTQHVASRGRQESDPLLASPSVPTVDRAAKKVQRDVLRAGVLPDTQPGGGTLFSERVLVVNQKPKIIEVNAEYAVYDRHGRQLGAVREVGQSVFKNAMGGGISPNRKRRLHIVDPSGRVLISLTRPPSMMKSNVVVQDSTGAVIGQIVQKSLGIISQARFSLESSGQALGSLNRESAQAWDFNIQDAAGSEISRITRSQAGLTTAMLRSDKRDKYVVEIHQELDEPLRSLVIASALAVDTALRD